MKRKSLKEVLCLALLLLSCIKSSCMELPHTESKIESKSGWLSFTTLYEYITSYRTSQPINNKNNYLCTLPFELRKELMCYVALDSAILNALLSCAEPTEAVLESVAELFLNRQESSSKDVHKWLETCLTKTRVERICEGFSSMPTVKASLKSAFIKKRDEKYRINLYHKNLIDEGNWSQFMKELKSFLCKLEETIEPVNWDEVISSLKAAVLYTRDALQAAKAYLELQSIYNRCDMLQGNEAFIKLCEEGNSKNYHSAVPGIPYLHKPMTFSMHDIRNSAAFSNTLLYNYTAACRVMMYQGEQLVRKYVLLKKPHGTFSSSSQDLSYLISVIGSRYIFEWNYRRSGYKENALFKMSLISEAALLRAMNIAAETKKTGQQCTTKV